MRLRSSVCLLVFSLKTPHCRSLHRSGASSEGASLSCNLVMRSTRAQPPAAAGSPTSVPRVWRLGGGALAAATGDGGAVALALAWHAGRMCVNRIHMNMNMNMRVVTVLQSGGYIDSALQAARDTLRTLRPHARCRCRCTQLEVTTGRSTDRAPSPLMESTCRCRAGVQIDVQA